MTIRNSKFKTRNSTLNQVQGKGIDRWLAEFRGGSNRACGKLLTIIENDDTGASYIFRALCRGNKKKAWRIGVTGPPGSGKSTIVEKLAHFFRRENKSLGIVCVDPSSPFSGGALLGDRIRMAPLFLDPEIFIRSMATRKSRGGLAQRTREVCDLLDAFGKDIILLETIGVGQDEFDVIETTETVIVVLVPESGDSVQALKAGLMEIGDLFVVNKSDHAGADEVARAIEMVLALNEVSPKGGFPPRSERDNNSPRVWQPPVIKTTAIENKGIEELYCALYNHYSFLTKTGLLKERRRFGIRATIKELVEERIITKVWACEALKEKLEELTDQVLKGEITPFDGADELYTILKKNGN